MKLLKKFVDNNYNAIILIIIIAIAIIITFLIYLIFNYIGYHNSILRIDYYKNIINRLKEKKEAKGVNL